MIYRILFFALELWSLIYTVSYARWEWQNNNKSGAVGIGVLCTMVVVAGFVL